MKISLIFLTVILCIALVGCSQPDNKPADSNATPSGNTTPAGNTGNPTPGGPTVPSTPETEITQPIVTDPDIELPFVDDPVQLPDDDFEDTGITAPPVSPTVPATPEDPIPTEGEEEPNPSPTTGNIIHLPDDEFE